MIRVSITVGATELGYIELERVDIHEDLADYSIRFGVIDGVTMNVYQRPLLNVPHRTNTLGILLHALNLLETNELELSDAPGTATDLARRLDPAMRALQASLDRDSDH